MNEQDSLDIQALVDGELDARSAERLRQRLDSEPESAALVRELTALDELLASAPEPSVPPDLARRILQRAHLPVDRRLPSKISRVPSQQLSPRSMILRRAEPLPTRRRTTSTFTASSPRATRPVVIRSVTRPTFPATRPFRSRSGRKS